MSNEKRKAKKENIFLFLTPHSPFFIFLFYLRIGDNKHSLLSIKRLLWCNKRRLFFNQHRLFFNRHRLFFNRFRLNFKRFRLNFNRHRLFFNRHRLNFNRFRLNFNRIRLNFNRFRLFYCLIGILYCPIGNVLPSNRAWHPACTSKIGDWHRGVTPSQKITSREQKLLPTHCVTLRYCWNVPLIVTSADGMVKV